MTALNVHEVRFRATVQDLGRPGLAHLGVPTAGAVDRGSLRHANRLVGNDDNAAAIEVLLGGFTCVSSGEMRVAVVGALWTIDGESVRSEGAEVSNGSTVVVGDTTGAYAYVAVAGGVDVEPVLGSRSTDTLSGLGPPPIKPGDVLPVGLTSGLTPRPTEQDSKDRPLRIVVGPREDWFTSEAVQQLVQADWTVTPKSDRTGLRLSGPTLQRRTTSELPSEGMVSGAIQVPPDGQPIVFLANHPTTGGYPVIAVVVSADVGRLAQHRPGSRLQFETVA